MENMIMELGNKEDLDGYLVDSKDIQENTVESMELWSKIVMSEFDRRTSEMAYQEYYGIKNKDTDYLQETDNKIDKALSKNKSKYFKFAIQNQNVS